VGAMSDPLLVDSIGRIEAILEAAELGLQVSDKPRLRGQSDSHLHRGVTVNVPTTENTDNDRNAARAQVIDAYEVEMAYKIRAKREHRTSRDEALVLEAQVRQVLTSRHDEWPIHLVYQRSLREYQGESNEWFIITQTFSARRYASLGG